MCPAQRGSMEAKALSIVLHAAGSERHKASTRRVFTYVVGGRVGINDIVIFRPRCRNLIYKHTPSTNREESLCIPHKMCLAVSLTINSNVMRPTAIRFFVLSKKCGPSTAPGSLRFSSTTRLGVITAIANFHSRPSPEDSQMLTKELSKGDVGLFDSKFLAKRGSLL